MRGALTFGVVLLMITGANADVVHCKDGRVLHGKVTSENKQSLMLQSGGITITIATAEVQKVERGDDVEAAAKPTAEPECGLPNILSLLNSVTATGEQNARVVPADNATTVQREEVGGAVTQANQSLVQSAVGQRVSVAGTVRDVTSRSDGYCILIAYPADTPRISQAERRTINECEAAAKQWLQKAKDANSTNTRDKYKRYAEQQRATIAQINLTARRRIPQHLVYMITSDRAAVELRRGSGVSAEATITACSLRSQRNGDTMQCYVVAETKAASIGKSAAAALDTARDPATQETTQAPVDAP